ncbi:MAG: CYTH domain-containing protein [Gemmatimonadetes bacterium]|nr:CYTH domain-containing protein [Gemmatimonadota bacterium]
MPEDSREIEIALLIRSGRPREVADWVAALAAVGGYRLVPRASQAIRDRYVDTPDRLLRRHRAGLRVREVDGRRLLTLKGERRRGAPGEPADRMEVELPWSAAALARVLEVLATLGVALPAPVAGVDDGDPFAALAAIGLEVVQDRSNRRRVRDVVAREEDGGPALAELVVDSVRYAFHGREALHHEVEVEAKAHCDPALLREVAGALRERFPGELVPWPHSKQATGAALEALLGGPEADSLTGPGGDLEPEAYDRIARFLDEPMDAAR